MPSFNLNFKWHWAVIFQSYWQKIKDESHKTRRISNTAAWDL